MREFISLLFPNTKKEEALYKRLIHSIAQTTPYAEADLYQSSLFLIQKLLPLAIEHALLSNTYLDETINNIANIVKHKKGSRNG